MDGDSIRNDFIVVSHAVKGDLVITGNYQYNHVDAENVTVTSGVRARIYGNISRKLVLQKGSKLFIHGKVTGEIIDEGGRYYIFDV